MKYYKPLDGLRGVAVLLVMFRHWHLPFLNIELGWVGVNIFFVLSGFLISSIILEDKQVLNLKKFIKIFYIKRTLRIFPIYFSYLGLLSVFLLLAAKYFDVGELDKALTHLKHNWGLLVTYTYNNHSAIELISGEHVPGTKFIGHLWSLALEEQFYLIFPFLAFFLSTKKIKYSMIVILILSPLLRWYIGDYLITAGYSTHLTGLTIYKSTLFQLDSIATGVLLSTLNINKINLTNKRFLIIITFIFSFLMVVVFFLKRNSIDINYSSLTFQLLDKQIGYQTGTILDYYYSISFSILNLISALFIVACIKGLRIIKILEHIHLVKLGQISYGVYLYHNGLYVIFSLTSFWLIGKELIISQWWLEVILFCLFFLITISISNLSFRYFESPFLKYKKRITTTMYKKH